MNSQSIPDVLTLFDVLRYRASAASGTADAPAFTYLDDGEHVSGALSYAELDLAARKLAARLQRITKPGDRVLLVYPPSLDYIVAFYGCVYAGVTAVPALPPANRRTLPRLRLMAADSQPTAALTLARIRDSVTKVEDGDPDDDILRQLSWLSTDDADGDESAWVPPAAQAADIVFLQYTSGSTGAPKGVMVTHHNLLANLRLFRQMFDVRSGETFVFWLPPHHDFGLIGAIIMPVFAGAHSVQFPPAAFMMSPVRWLRLIARYRARLTGAPNFAFQLCVDKISDAQMQGLDLGCLDVAMNGAERIRFESVTQFAEKFAAYGFRRESMMPSYGMAEFVLLATANMHRAAGSLPNAARISKTALAEGRIVPSDRPHDAVHIVSVGRTHEDLHDMAVVDPVTLERQSERQVGEVWLCGPAVTQGYWGRDDAARQETFHARIKGDEREWLRTGDVGFVSEGELFITGRSKEVMIFGGRNIYPQDVEMTVERASPAFRANGCAAFSLEEGDTAQLVIVQEVESRRRLETESLIARLRADIAEQHDIFDLAAVVLVRPGHLPRTSSGKIQRSRCRQMHLAGELDSIWSWHAEHEDAPAELATLPQTSTETRLLALWRDLFGNPALSMSDNFFRLGGHSLLAAQLVAAVGTEFRVDLPLRALFEASNVVSLAAVIDTLQPRKAIADELLASPQHGDLPLSFVQQRFWFLDQYQPANAFYAVPVAMRLSGELVLPALQQALDAMTQRHAALRTVFPVTDGVPRQQVLPALSWPLQVSDVGDLAVDRIDTQIRQVMMEEARKPFDLARGPLIRARLLNRGTELHVLLLTLHHIVHDGWSVSVLIDELAQAYAACKADQPAALPALPVSYADYTQWERRRYGEQNIRTDLAYWVEHLRGASPLLALPTDRPRPALMSHRGATHATHLPAGLVRRVAEQASQRNATLFMALTSAVQILLHRYCSQDDICMSMLSANRPAKTENVIGAFVNVVPLRAQFTAGQVFADVLAATTQEVLSAYEQQLPFELILNRLARERHAAYTPYAQVVLNFHSELENQGRARQHGLEQSLQFDGRWTAGVAHTAFDLLLDVREWQGGLEVVFEYSTDLFDAASIQRWGTHLRHVLEGMAESFDSRVDELTLLDAAERELILDTFNATAQTWQAASLVHQLFETTAERQPDAIALVGEDEQLSYRSLNQRANQLAHALIARGIRPDDRIALCVERSTAMVVGLLGILKAGGAYVPVDPDYPPERSSYMLTDNQPRLLLSSRTLRDRLPAIDVPVLWLDDPESLSTQPEHNPDPHALGLRSDHLAYVIYTSGSTGQPKGAMNQHDGVVNRLLWAQQQFALDADDRVLQKTPYAFDVSVWEFFLPLLAGAQLVLARPGGHQSPAYLAQCIADAGITVAHFVPSMLQVFLDQGDLSGCARMRHVLCSGEALPPVLQNRFLQKLPGVALHNLYGPTEAAVDVSYWPCTEPGTVVPIGRPIANTRLYVLDARMQPVPIGVAGELYIGGVQVGRGYLHRPALTEERFVANPFGSGRLYKTGDLGRWRVDGAIEYLGRNDFQVKLRGFRIELGEIEARLLEHPAIREAVVIAREETSGDKRLVAYMVQNRQGQNEEAGWDDSRVEQWRQLYQAEYGKALDVLFGEDFRTWNSSYDGQPIPLEQMREWRDATVARILALQPRRVLEIGCGSGLILSQLAPHCESYCGTDLSAEVVARLRVQVAQQAHLAARVSLHCQPAHSSGNLPRQHFDVIVINSVAQCFPSADYMLAVLHQAMNLLAPGGAIFLGDIRNLPLLRCLITAIQLEQADDTADVASLRSAIERELRLEQELVFDPDFFASLPNRIEGIAGVDIRIKRGHFSNELSRYRYDVVLHKETAHVTTLATLPRLHWGKDVVDVASLSRHLQTPSFAGLRLCGVGNEHLANEAEAVHAFEQERSQDEVMESLRARHALQSQASASLPHPEDLHTLGTSLGLETIVTWSSQHGKAFQRGELDVLFVQPGQRAYTDIYAASHELRPLDELTTQPAQQESANQLLAELRDSLSRQLPDYMLPSAFVVLDALPLTPSGKLDRGALPAPDRDAVVTHKYESPQSEVEETIAAIWSAVLGLSPIGRHDHFFELGGHSLLATQVASKLRASLSVDVPLKALFEHPTLAALAAHVQEQVSVAPRDAGFDMPLMRMVRPPTTPASFAQQRLWFIEQLDHEQPVYTMTYAVRLRGELDVHALQASLADVVARHESLRAHFIESDGVAMQHVADVSPLTLQLVDLSCGENGTLQAWMANAARQVFDLRTPPLIRLTLLQEHPAQHVLVISAHHIVADGWSLGIFNRELSALYNAHRHRQPSPLRELSFQYADFAHWQRQCSEKGVFEQPLAYWQKRLQNAPAMVPLPTDRPRAAVPSHRGDVVRCVVPKTITHNLKLLVQRTEASLFMGLAAALAALLSRHTGQNDICIGTPVANRQHVALDDVIGFFVNTLVLRIDTDGSQSIDTLLRQARDVALDAYAHQEVPFDQVVASLDRARHDLHSPLFQVMLVLQNTVVDDLAFEHIEAEVLPIHNGTAKFDLTVAVTETDGELACEFEYSVDLFERSTIARIARQFERVLHGMALDPTQAVDRLPLLDAAEHLQVVETFNATDVPYPADALIHQLFEQQALAYPDAVALLHNDQSLSYGELNRRANRVAHALIEQGVGPDDRVAIGMERGVALIVGLLGILKAGGAYVPLDPAYPAERLAYMLRDSAPAALLTQRSLQASWMSSSVPCLLLDDDGALSSLHSELNPDVRELMSRHLAYVMYTSGSTGEPKGVMVEHRSVLRLVINNTFAPLTPQDVVVHAAKIAFDAATWEVWGGLLNGARVLLIDEAKMLEPARFVQALAEGKATSLFLTTALFNQYVDVLMPILPQFRHLLFGGEAADAHTVRRVLASTPPRQLSNIYGPTETTTFAAVHAIKAVAENATSLPIGAAIANTRGYILDRHGEPVPVGVPGEIHIGGPGVARGYWNRPQLTAERFLRDPFVDDPQARMYKTGDLGRWLPNGEIEYLGRNDFQVKIRGFRIELGEIEAKLLKLTNVRNAVVIAREDVPGDKRLVAYLTSRDGQALWVATLRDALANELADYMLPSAFVQLEQWPLTPNGKLDRRALPAPDQQSVVTRAYEAPQGDVEQAIAAIWQELLGLERVGRHDHFFELGGHSLLAVQVIARLRQQLQVDLSLRDLFAQPTLQAQAQIATHGMQIPLAPIPLADRRDELPLSWAQQRLWFIHQLDPAASLSYHMPGRLRLCGRLHVEALQATFERIAARHEVLRTRFMSVEGRAVQVIEASGHIPFVQHDLRECPDPEKEVRRLAWDEAHAPFDLSNGPLLRTRLLQLADDDHILLLTQHHIVSDGWSIGVLVREISALYGAYGQGHPDPLPALPIQYADYAVWQRDEAQRALLQRQAAYWKAQLEGAPTLLSLPTDRPRPAVQSYAGDQLAWTLAPDAEHALRTLSQRHGTTLFMTALAAWSIVLSRWSGQGEVVIGTPVANRQRSELEPLLGFFVNTLALRIRLDDAPTVEALLARIKPQLIDAYAHQDLPFEQLVEALQPPRNLSHSPVFQVMLTMNNTPEAALDLPGLRVEVLELERTTAHFDVDLSLQETERGLVGNLSYASDLFERGTIERMAQHFMQVLRGMSTDMYRPIDRLPLLDDRERYRVLETFNATAAPYPDESLIHQLFEQQVERSPNAIAVVFEDQVLTYAQLNAHANRLAHYLIAQGIQPGDCIATVLERSAALVTAQLAILKAGATYVPIDPQAPATRQAWMIADCAARQILIDTTGVVPADIDIPVVVIESVAGDVVSTPNPDLVLSSEAAAYVMYTSGSTGTPKGVLVPHRGVNRLIINNGYASFETTDRIAWLGNPAFDISTLEVWAPLLHGACLVVVTYACVLQPSLFRALLQEQRVTVLHLTAGLFSQMVDSLGEVLTRLRLLLVGGDAVDVATVARVLERYRPQHLLHCYGPTESTTFATTCEITELDLSKHRLPIGRPIANTRIYLLDAHGQPAPIGVAGELYIGGAGVANGYLNRPELTAERFLADPFSADADARMYRTGDLARYLPDGQLEFLGRNDHQLKIRGYRIEPGEIEARLAEHPAVREAVVIAREDRPGDKRLVAYVIAQDTVDEADALVVSLRTHLGAHLPDYMLPSAFVQLEQWPLTPNGKLDRRALPAPDQQSVVTRAYEAPQGDVEQAIAAIWQELLGLERVGRHDHFFELGGHSLLAVQVIARLRQQLQVDLSLRDLFAQPTLQAQAQIATHGMQIPLAPIPLADRRDELPLSWAQQRLWFIHQLDPAASLSYHMPGRLRLRGRLHVEALQATFERIAARHEVLRTRFMSVEGRAVQVIEANGHIPLVQHDLRGYPDPEKEVRRLAWDEAHAPFDLSNGPLLRTRLLQLADDDHILLLTQHHIVSDGWSIGVLVHEISALYGAYGQGHPDPLPALPIQYADYAVWQRDEAQRALLQKQAVYWKAQLEGAPTLLSLPTDRPRPAVQSYAGDQLTWTLAPDAEHALRTLSRRHGTTLFMTALAAWSIVLSRWSGQGEVVIGTPVANRQRSELEPLLGFFVNTLALRIRLDDAPTVEALLARIKPQLIDAYAHQDLPFEQLVEALQPPRNLSHSPVFQVMLTMNNTPEAALDLPGLRVEVLELERTTAHFDVILSLQETEGSLVGNLSYASDLFERGTIERMAQHFMQVLRGMSADMHRPIDRLPLLDSHERQQLLTRFSASTETPAASSTLIHTLFEQQARRTPDAIALRYEDHSLTYAQLNAQANRLAHALIDRGVKPDDRVALGMERSLAMVIGILGILKAGAGYVPLDPSYPAERLAYLLEDSAPALLLTQASLQGQWPGNVPVLHVDDPSVHATQPTHNPQVDGLTARHLAYVIYTSGTTGQPKGVMIEHAQVARLFATTDAMFRFGADDVWTLFHSCAFDFSVWELWGALAYGGRLVIVPSLCARSPKDFYALLCREQVTVLNQTPSAFRALIAAQDTQQHRLRYVIFGGEALELHTLTPWIARNDMQQTKLVNMYGITETTVHVTYRALTREDIETSRGSLVGRGLPDLQVYILDHHGEPVPEGVAGELHIGGAGVARGYWNRPQLTAERFLRDPFVNDPGARMYKSGDVGRWLPHGEIEYLGRNDAQVKIRGFRIELGEIEAKLLKQVNVREAVVIAREDVSGDKRLVAYLSTRDGQPLSTTALRDALAKELAEYMLPSAFVQLEQWPLTAHGKLDRQALPAPDRHSVVTRDYEAPHGKIEQAIAAIWQELLGLERVGRHDHFFELGGHSLLAVQMMAQLRTACRAELPLRALFDAPTLAMLAAAARQAQTQTMQADDDIVHHAHDGTLPLSFAQQRFWFLDQYQLANTFYNVGLMVSLRGTLDPGALEQAIQRMIERHGIFRTVFPSTSGVPQQVIQPGLHLPWRFEDVGDGPENDTRIRAAMAKEAKTPFDLAHGPLLRARLLRCHAQEHVLLLTIHHIVYDGWCTRILMDELSHAYAAFKTGTPVALPELPVDYADYTRWEQRRYALDHIEDDLAYWKAQLKEAPPLLALPTDRPRQALMTHHGAIHRIHLPDTLIQRLTMLANERHATLFMALTAITQMWLHRYCGQQDICVGVISASRPPGTEMLIGNFINILPLTTHISETSSFVDLIDAAAKNLLAAYDRQLPFELILQHMLHEHRSAYIPYSQVVLNFHSELDGASLAWTTDDALSWQVHANDAREIEYAAFDLKLDMNQLGDGLELVFEYNTDLFDAATIERWSAHYQMLLESVCADPLGNVHHFNLLTSTEQQAFASAWRETRADYPRDTSIGELFDLQASRTPDAVAVVHRDRSLSYRELRHRADQLAAFLRNAGVGPDTLVGIYTERSIEMLLAVLAVVKAGAAYVPLDPAYPQARIAHMLSDACPPMVLTEARFASRLEGMAPCIISVDALDAVSGGDDISVLPPLGTPANLAYVIYTSGSTGRPKGAMVHRQGFVNLLHWYIRQFDLRADDKVLLLSSFSFDLTQKNIFSMLLVGGQLHLPASEDALSGAGDYVERHGITYLNCAPSAFYPLLADGGARRLSSLRQVFLGGEPIRVALIHDAYRGLSQVPRIHNTYGPTEASDVVSFHTWDPRIAVSTLPIGRAIANTRLYVLDGHRQLLPQGAVGELYVGGDGVGRGYLHLAALTQERFLPDPYAEQPNARMYRTGDVVRQLPGGEIEYLGRNDFQVKIRGFRIELGEIEAKLAACAGVREAVVIDREDAPGDKRLVAYLTAHDGQGLSNAVLRDSLAKELADYMLPSAFVQLEQLPLTPNGKLDRQALPAPDQQSVVSREYEAPQDEIEQAIATIWQQLLGLERVGRHDHFFELGGHSLLATQLVSRIGAAFGIGLPLRAVFEAPTLAELAACAKQSERKQDAAPIPRIERDRALPLSFAQQRLWFLDQFESQRGIYNIPAAVRLTGSLDVDALERTLNEIVRRHEVLRTSFVLAGDAPVQVIAPMVSLPLDVVDLSETQARLLMQAEAGQPFDLSTGPLIRFRLIRLAVQEHILLVTVHHIVSDGWSMGVVVREVAALYPAFMQGQPSPLPDLPIHYADFAHWQRQWLSGDVLERQRHYWKQRLAGSPSLLALPTDRPRPSNPSHAGATVPFDVPAALVARLQALGSPTQSTLFMVLCTAFNVLLARYANQTDICIGTPIANRNRGDIEALIGFFVNTLVLRTEVDLAGDFHTLLRQVHQHTLDAYAHQDVPFEQLVEVLQPERNTSYTPLFQVMLTLHNTPMDELALPGLSMSPVKSENATAKFDLSLSLAENKDGLEGYFEYSTDLFDISTIERMRNHFAHLLQMIAAEPNTPVGDLAMLSEDERQQLLYRFNDNVATISPDPRALHQLFEAQAARTPQHVAVVHEGVALSYAELNQRANQLAHHLRKLGVGPDGLVGICMTRTPDLIVSLLGVLKAGGAYVPLDPAYPPERVATMLTDARPRVLLTQQHWRDGLPSVAGTRVFCIDAEAALLADYASDNPVHVASGDDLAYVIYTSGSTGKPKGVAIQHRNVTTFVHWALATFDRNDLEKVLASTSICFDLSIFEIFVPLSRGGSVWLVDNILALAETPDALPVTLINTVPSAIAEVHRSIRLPASVRVINLAGEALSHMLVQALYQQSSVERIYNLYGPSEDTTYSTFTLVAKDSAPPVTIGRPIANTQAYILDARQHPVPVGVAGELCMAGDGLARGYLNRPELSAEKFVPNPFGTVPGARMYRTGDLARYLPDGQIEYLGRVDHQVKIRGFRIELGEIETVLSGQPNVRDAVVTAREDMPGDKRLVAYITTHDGQSVPITELRHALAKELPEYMLPGAFVQLQQLPLTPNGKLDRQALPAPDRQVLATHDYEAPQGDIEQTIAAVWQEVLGLERVGRQDHFFELGGHSLLAVRVIARLCRACHVDIPLAALFKAPELAAFAQVVLSLQVETFLGDDIEAIQQELDALSEEQLLAILEKDVGRE